MEAGPVHAYIVQSEDVLSPGQPLVVKHGRYVEEMPAPLAILCAAASNAAVGVAVLVL